MTYIIFRILIYLTNLNNYHTMFPLRKNIYTGPEIANQITKIRKFLKKNN